MSVVAEIERKLARQRWRHEADDDDVPVLRTSTMTHVVWAPPRWLDRAKRVLAGMAERHPARTIFLVPTAGRTSSVEAHATVLDFADQGSIPWFELSIEAHNVAATSRSLTRCH